MDEEKILIYDMEKEKDLTNQIKYWTRDKNYYEIYYYNHPSKKYRYLVERLSIHSNPIPCDPTSQWMFKGEALTNIKKILCFGVYYKVFFPNATTVYSRSELKEVKNLLSEVSIHSIFSYYKALTPYIKIKSNQTLKTSSKNDLFLKNIYEQIDFISEDSVLNLFLNPNKKMKSVDLSSKFLYPFAFNLSQKEVINHSLKNQVTIIQGPPGTGKTQTILNLIANLLMNQKTVAVLSNNNSATDNVYEKLEAKEIAAMVAKLGNKKNRATFLTNQWNRKPFPKEWCLEDKVAQELLTTLISQNKKIDAYLQLKNEMATLKQEHTNLKLEYEYVQKRHVSLLPKEDLPDFPIQKLYRLLVFLEHQKNKGLYFSKWVQWWCKIRFSRLPSQFFQHPIISILDSLEDRYYQMKLNEQEQTLEAYQKDKEQEQLKDSFENYTEQSMRYFRSFLSNHYSNFVKFSQTQLQHTKQFTKSYPVVLSTTYSLVECTAPNFLYDYMIIDESSQVDLVAAIPALAHAKNVVIVGDSKQLPCIISEDNKEIYQAIFQQAGIEECYNYLTHSLLDLASYLFPDHSFLLKEHYRCHPQIIQFCNQCYYENQLIILSEGETEHPMKQWRSVVGNLARQNADKSWFNQRQIDMILEELIPKEQLNVDTDSLGIISPYREQIRLLKNQLKGTNVDLGTVHSFQGRENDIIIFSTVANYLTTFLDNPNSINVAVSRAKNAFHLVTPDHYNIKDQSTLGNLISYISYHNFEVVESNLHSIFDLLYSVNRDQLKDYQKKYSLGFPIPSEDLIAHLLTELFHKESYQIYSFVAHYAMRKLVPESTKLSEEERAFVHTNAHIDFIIYNQFDKRPLLAIEVDGARHLERKQMIRDQKKNRILKTIRLPLLRLKTHEKDIEIRIQQAIDEAIQKKTF